MAQKTNQNSENIKKAALELFQERGYDNVTIADICEAAGCSTSTFRYQFGTKDTLLHSYNQVLTVIDQSILSSLLVLSGAWEKLWLIHEAFVDSVIRLGPALFSMILTSYIASKDLWSKSEGVIDSTELIIPLVSQGQSTGEIRNHSPAKDLAYTVTVQMFGVCIAWCADKGSYDLKAVMKKHLANLYDLREDLRKE